MWRRSIFIYALLGFVMSLFIAVNPLYAERFIDLDEYRVHYNTMNTEMIPADVAQQNRITRSKNRALLNISVMKRSEDDSAMMGTPVPSLIKVTATNLNQQLRQIPMRQIQSGDAVYYIGTFAVSNAETLEFAVTVDPEYKGEAQDVSFRQEFFVD